MTTALLYGIAKMEEDYSGDSIIGYSEVHIIKNTEDNYDLIKEALMGESKEGHILDVTNIDIKDDSIFDKVEMDAVVWYDMDTENKYLNIDKELIHLEDYSGNENYFYGFDMDTVNEIFKFIHKIENKSKEYFDSL